MSGPANPLALEAAEALASCMADTQDKAMVRTMVRTRREGGRMPGMRILPPLAQVAARILDGDGTDEGAQYWLRQALLAHLAERHPGIRQANYMYPHGRPIEDLVWAHDEQHKRWPEDNDHEHGKATP